MNLDAVRLEQFCPAALPYLDGLADGCAKTSIDTPLRLCHFLAQCAHESRGFTHTHEIFDYTPEALTATFGSHLTPQQASTLGRQEGEAFVPADRQAQIADIVYAGRGGNGDGASGDGSRYRGRGLIQLTFKQNYTACTRWLGVDLVSMPERLEQPRFAALSACWYWQENDIDAAADADDLEGVTRLINPALAGLENRRAWLEKAKAVWLP